MAYHPLRLHPDTVARQQMLARLLRRCESSQRSAADSDAADDSRPARSTAEATCEAVGTAIGWGPGREK